MSSERAHVLAVGAMVGLHSQDPRQWNVSAPKSGDQYFQPSLARTSTGNFIPAETLMMDEYCLKCHQDAYKGWFHSSHHFSSFNNPAYLASVRETREVAKVVGGSDYGRDALEKAHGVIERTRVALDRHDTAAIKEQVDALSRTLRMFKGVVQKG